VQPEISNKLLKFVKTLTDTILESDAPVPELYALFLTVISHHTARFNKLVSLEAVMEMVKQIFSFSCKSNLFTFKASVSHVQLFVTVSLFLECGKGLPGFNDVVKKLLKGAGDCDEVGLYVV